MQLHPREKFIITRQLQNPYITDTFYVRAVIRNAKTDAVIDTLDLVDRTGQRFTKEWLVPADPTGLGFYVSIVTSVYSDSGYTIKDQNYGDEETTYLIQDRYVFNPNYPVGTDIDYKRIKKMIDDAIKNIVIPEPKVVTVVNEKIREVKIPELKIVETQKTQDLSSIINAINKVAKKIYDKPVNEITEKEEVNFEPVLKEIGNISKDVNQNFEKINNKIDNLKVEIKINNPIVEATAKSSVASPMKDERISKLMKLTS